MAANKKKVTSQKSADGFVLPFPPTPSASVSEDISYNAFHNNSSKLIIFRGLPP